MTLPEPTLLPAPGQRNPLRPITGILLERILGRCIAVFSIVFGAQGIPFALMQQGVLKQPLGWLVVGTLFGAFAAVILTGFSGRFLVTVAPLVPIIYLVALTTWPLGVADPSVVQPTVPWLWYVANLVLATAVVAFSTWVSAMYVVLIPTVLFVVRLTPSGGGATVEHALLDSAYVAILGAVVLVVVLMLRRAAADVDQAQDAAVVRYGDAVRAHAIEVERLQVDSIVHDGVLTALLSAGKAETPKARRLAAVMAGVSMARLISAAETPTGLLKEVSLAKVRERLDRARGHLDPDARLSAEGDIGSLSVPAEVAQTLADAAVQALVNSCQHAGDSASRWITVAADGDQAVVIVGDDGAGFDPSVSSERLGVRVSILERVRTSGGLAEIVSAPGRGTVVTLRWRAATGAQEHPDSIPA